LYKVEVKGADVGFTSLKSLDLADGEVAVTFLL
jgi:hypothetical protein